MTAANGPCRKCGRNDALAGASWSAPNDVWNALYRSPGGAGEDGLRCGECFVADCEQAGLVVIWRAECGKVAP